jgi:thiol-disulfide isomerase/thioredoxin
MKVLSTILKATKANFKKLKITDWFLLGLILLALVMRGPTLIEQFKLQNTSIKPISLNGQVFPIQGQKSAFIFWASWCGPCSIELKRIQKAIDEKEISNEKIFAINMGETQEVINKVLKEQKYTMKIIRDDNGDLSKMLNVQVTPTIALIDEKGSIDWISSGLSPFLIYRIKSFLKG